MHIEQSSVCNCNYTVEDTYTADGMNYGHEDRPKPDFISVSRIAMKLFARNDWGELGCGRYTMMPLSNG